MKNNGFTYGDTTNYGLNGNGKVKNVKIVNDHNYHHYYRHHHHHQTNDAFYFKII